DYRLLFFQGEIYRRLARSQAFRRKTQSAAAPRQAHMQSFLVIGFEKHAAVRIHHGDGVIQHHAQHFVERELGVEERGSRGQLVQLAQARAGAANRVGAGDAPHAGQQVGDGVFAGGRGGAVDNLVRIDDAEGDDVAVLQFAAFHLFAVYEEPTALAAIFDVMLVGLNYDRSAST